MEATGSRIIRYPKRNAEFSIWAIFDIHLGNIGCSKEHLLKDIDRIRRDPYSLWVGGGDSIDCIYPGDKRFDPECFPPEFSVRDLTKISALLVSHLLSYFRPIKHKCLGWGYGNHELAYMRRDSTAFLHDYIVQKLGTRNMRYSGWMDLYFVYDPSSRGVTMKHSDIHPTVYTSRLRVFSHHGAGSAATAGGKINRLKSLVDMTDADLVLCGHLHEAISKPFVRLSGGTDCNEVKQRVTMGMMTGSYLRIYGDDHTSYGEQMAYFPTTIGASRAKYIPAERILVVENRADNIGIGMT